MKGFPWFRLYVEILNDGKLKKLSDSEFRFWISCLCLARINEGFLPSVEDIAWQLRMAPTKAAQLLNGLREAHLVDTQEDGKLTPHGWSDRQFESDSSRERTRQYRARLSSRRSDVTATVEGTAQEAEADSESDTEAEVAAVEQIQKHTRRTGVSRAVGHSATATAAEEVIQKLQAHPEFASLNVRAEFEKCSDWYRAHSEIGGPVTERRVRKWCRDTLKDIPLSNGASPGKPASEKPPKKEQPLFMGLIDKLRD